MASFLQAVGFCPTCDREVTFSSAESWLRDHFLCSNCQSIPRERALMHAIELYYPDYKELSVYESSPVGRGASVKLETTCADYTASHYDPSVPFGECHPVRNYRSENLEALTFADEAFDLVVTQDVMEHVLDPERAFAEIARVLRPGGAHLFTTPLVNELRPSERCAVVDSEGEIEYLTPPEYHGDPVDPMGALVTMHWGYDLVHWILRSSGLVTTILRIDDLSLGIRAAYIEVLVSAKI